MTFNTIDLINPIKLGVDKTRPTVKVGQFQRGPVHQGVQNLIHLWFLGLKAQKGQWLIIKSTNKVSANNLKGILDTQQKFWPQRTHYHLSTSRNGRVMMVSTNSSMYRQIRYLQITWMKSEILSRKVNPLRAQHKKFSSLHQEMAELWCYLQIASCIGK